MSENISRSSIFRSKMKKEYENFKLNNEMIKERKLAPNRRRVSELENEESKNTSIGREPGE